MSNEFEVVRDPEDALVDRPDVEEPSTWEFLDKRVNPEVDQSDWAEQHSPVESDGLDEEVNRRTEGPTGIALNEEP